MIAKSSQRIFSSFSTNHLEESIHFYSGVLGFALEVKGDKFLHVSLNEGVTVVIYAKDDHVPASYTVLNFQIEDIQKRVEELSKKGVVFEQYPDFDTDALGISWDDKGSQIAWFKDPGGNILALIEG